MQIALLDTPDNACQTLVICARKDSVIGATTLPDVINAAANRLILREGGKVGAGKILSTLLPEDAGPTTLVLAGLDSDSAVLSAEETGGALLAALNASKAENICLDLRGLSEDETSALLLGALLRNYRFTRYKSTDPDDVPFALTAISVVVDDAAALDARVEVAQAIAKAVHDTRDIVTEPGNQLYPEVFARECEKLRDLGVEVEILNQQALETLGFHALLAVGLGSARDSYVAVMRWRGAEQDAPVALVGKGVCFDTGGISLKPASGMEDMKFDMGGGAAVYGAMSALARRKAKVDVVGIIGMVENMPSDRATRPGDVISSLSGKTIEVINTDAEGRLVLADCLWYAKERFSPKAMVNLATLTGAIIVALGNETAGIFSNDDDLSSQIVKAGDAVAEPCWRLPINDDYDKHIDSVIADMKNVGRARQAGSIAAAVFLQRFVGKIPWVHIDIAGTAWASSDKPRTPKGATAFGVRLLDRLIADNYES